MRFSRVVHLNKVTEVEFALELLEEKEVDTVFFPAGYVRCNRESCFDVCLYRQDSGELDCWDRGESDFWKSFSCLGDTVLFVTNYFAG